MSNFQANLRALIGREYPLEQIVDMLNFKIREITKSARFITMFLGVGMNSNRATSTRDTIHPYYSRLERKLLKEGCPLLGGS